VIRDLVQPALTRWQPLRAGLVDLFYYDSEEFWFRDGRLLLRGNNGTGKSKVLALTLPFLLDGDLSSHRVEPDADPKKRMEWNLLLGGAHPQPERLGYTWIEFGRVDEDGEERFCTLGCGLKAVSGRGIARHWYFVTSRRVGVDLALVDATGTALARDRLADALGDQGTVYDRARDYRRAVDETLFSFGEQRYGALVDLLIQLRQPQLSKRPNEKALSDALTQALPPLDQAVIADVAEAFRSLEEDRDALRAMKEARDAATSFLSHYQRYARIHSRRKARQPREAQSVYERVTGELNAAEDEFTAAEESLAAARELSAALKTERSRLSARDSALRASPEMRSATALERADEDARRFAAEATRVAGERDQAVSVADARRGRLEVANGRLNAAREQWTARRQDALAAAADARIRTDHVDRVDGALDGQPDLQVLKRATSELIERQKGAIDHVRGLADDVAAASRTLQQARSKVNELDADAAALAERREESRQAVSGHAARLASSVRRHLEQAEELVLPDLAATIAALELWTDTLDGPNPAAAAVGAAEQARVSELATTDAAYLTRERTAREQADEITTEIDRLERGEDTAPPVPHTREDAARADRPGAPLWRLIDFADEVTEPDRAGLEAALEAAGILDAWVTPSGELLSPDTDDVVLRTGDAPVDNLSAVLRPAVDRADPLADAVSDEALIHLLESIGRGEDHGHTWVDPAGRFKIGVLEGAWHKPVARYIGRGAREAARRARLAVLRADLTAVEAELSELEAARSRLSERRATLSVEMAGLPGDEDLRQAHAVVAALVQEGERLAHRRSQAELAVTGATATEEGAKAALIEAAQDTGLPVDTAELSRVERALTDYGVALAGLWPAVVALQEAQRQLAEATADLTEAESSLTALTDRAGEATDAAAAAAELHETLLSTVGAAVAELQEQLRAVADEMRSNESEQTRASRSGEAAIAARGKAEGRREQLTEQLAAATTDRATAAESFRRFAGTGLLGVALPSLEIPDPETSWAPHPTVRLARRVNDELADVTEDDAGWDRAQHRVNTELKTLHDTLSRHGNRASADLREEGVVVEVEFQGRPASVPSLAEMLATEVSDRERLLDEREREILENHLINEVASTLQELISAAEAQVASMNAELERRPTSTGMRLRLQWRAREDGPAGLAAARERLLRQTADAWSDEDRSAVGEFLQAQIAEVRAADDTGTWLEHLTAALDYRAWNRFVIQRHQNGQWRPATGPASGGERVLAASVPLFAAASAHYASAGSPHAPRLITLDEAFAGVDDNARAKYLGLLAAFDLDVVMTSEREWGCYPQVPGLAISHLARTDGVDAVLVTNWEWDGASRTKVLHELHTLRDQGADKPAEPPQDGLWR